MKNVLITGTTSGIGKALAEKFAGEKMNVILVARDRKTTIVLFLFFPS